MDEYEVISAIRKGSPELPRGYLPIGDDVSAFPVPRGQRKKMVVLKCDMLVAKTDVPPGMSWRDVGRKAVAMCVSDFAAKGVRPSTFMVSLGIPRRTADDCVRSLSRGFAAAAEEWDIRLIGGDTNEAEDLVVDCVMAGFADRIVPRGGARKGDYVVTTGSFGLASAGLKMLIDGASADPGFRDEALRAVFKPTPRLEVGLAISRYLSSSIDSSDGLAISLHTIARMSGVVVRLQEPLPLARGLEAFASLNSLSAEGLALYGGEEYEIVGTVPAGRLADARRAAREKGSAITVIGATTGEGTPGAAGRVILPDERAVEEKGWVHFRSRS